MDKSNFFKALLLLLVLTLLSYGTIRGVGGNISQSTVWASDTIRVTDCTVVENGITLTINPGVYIVFEGHFGLNIQGQLLAEGNKDDSIRFLPKDTSVGWYGIRFDNTPHTNDSSKLNYCIITGGKAKTGASTSDGGGLYLNYYSSVMISYCRFSNNNTLTGGALFLQNSNPIIVNTVISNNIGVGYGGGIRCTNSNPIIINCLIAENFGYIGGGCDFVDSDPIIVNSHIVRNVGFEGAGIRCFSSNPHIINTILWSNSVLLGDVDSDPNFSYCDIQGGVEAFQGPGSGDEYEGVTVECIDVYPQFIDTSKSNYQLVNGSPCLNKGSREISNINFPITDLAGNERVNRGIIDIGAYEIALGLNINNPFWQNRKNLIGANDKNRIGYIILFDIKGRFLGTYSNSQYAKGHFHKKLSSSCVIGVDSHIKKAKLLIVQ